MLRASWAVALGAAAAPSLAAPALNVSCSDDPPDPQYSCAQQQSWGKCSESWMAGHCCQTCYGCAAGCGGPAPVPRPSCDGQAPELSQSSAGPAAQALFQKLAAHWAAGDTLTGHAGSGSWDDMVNRAGKAPAVRGFDFQNYSPHNPWSTSWSGWDDGTVASAIDWYHSTGQKGVVTFQWHWFSPMGGSQRTSTFNTKDTDFDTSRAVVPGTDENAATVRDLNAIAQQIQRLKDAGVPILWRPLHEAAGNQWGAWFWWGRSGVDVCKQLLDMMRDVFINQHGLDNLLWVWSEPNPAWYPGNDKIDLWGFDSYPGAYQYVCDGDTWNQYLQTTGCRKMLALTEVGPVPHVEKCFHDHIRWLYFLTWDTLGRDQNTDDHLRSVYNSAHVKSLPDMGAASNLVV